MFLTLKIKQEFTICFVLSLYYFHPNRFEIFYILNEIYTSSFQYTAFAVTGFPDHPSLYFVTMLLVPTHFCLFFFFFLRGLHSLNRDLFTRIIKFQYFPRLSQSTMFPSGWLGQRDVLSDSLWLGIVSSTRSKPVIYHLTTSLEIRQSTSTIYFLPFIFL